ncbi:MAG: nucleoside triphosphate pyrophosphohydrolase [Bacillota bacterium]
MLKIVGLGAGGLQLLTREAYQILQDATNLYLRTEVHPAAQELKEEGLEFNSFDRLYETENNFSEIYKQIAGDILELVAQQDVVYAVPGHPLVAEDSVKNITTELDESAYEIIAGPSFLDAIFARLNLDPIEGFKTLDGLNFTSQDLEPKFATIISQVYNRNVASEIKLELMKVYHDQFKIKVLKGIGLADEEVIEVPLYKLDRLEQLDHLTTVYLPPDESNPTQLNKLVEIMELLRSDNGCPWDQKQDYDSLKKHLLEEVYEVIDRIERSDYFGLAEELGDLLLQIVFLAQIGTEEGYFDIHGVISHIVEKMIRRHPHVFGNTEVETATEVLDNWEEIKKQEQTNQPNESEPSLLDQIPLETPALLQAQQIQVEAQKVGFDWPTISGAVKKVDEELAELKEELIAKREDEAQEELGDLLFAVVNIARFLDTDAEISLRNTINKFKKRFKYIEKQARVRREKLSQISLTQLEDWWTEAKVLQEGEEKND